ncbi:MAG: pro-sigmaK processing inhibitor BofA family protein [Clostridia bacterium]|nr:pro-sigmaK processing inhibitor BofA family protein [Clostridia bacterium]
MPLNYTMAAIFAISLIVVYIIMWVFAKPIKIILKAAFHGALGCIALMGYNFLAAPLGAAVGVNTYTAVVCGVLGIPGFCMLILSNIFIF